MGHRTTQLIKSGERKLNIVRLSVCQEILVVQNSAANLSNVNVKIDFWFAGGGDAGVVRGNQLVGVG